MNNYKQCDCETVSNCCGASIDTDILICYECKEHSDIAECECEVLDNTGNSNKIVDSIKHKIKNGCLDLGCMNGWSDNKWVIYRELQTLQIVGSGSSRELGRCYNESSFDILINGEVVKVISSVDSSD